MKKIMLLFLTIFVFSFSLLSSENESYYSYSFARLSYVKGDVYIQRASDLGYEEGVVNLPIVEGDKLGTRDGRAEIHFGKKNYLRADYNTQVDFINLPRRVYDHIKIHLLSGNIYLRIRFLEIEKSFEVHTPDASFYILEEGLYRFDVRENNETELFVYDGAMEAAGEEGSLLVKSEQRLVVSKGNFRSSPISFYASLSDSFAEWSEYRDSLLNRRVSKKYLPSELYEYEAELAYNGRWVYEQPYGYVWIPSDYHYGWRPYFYGRWVWYPIIGWNWVSYDSWGWCVYHYGRWHWRRGLGWYWIPTRIWGPGWVHWYWGYDYIGWCPISYYGYPVVVINNYFYGRYYSRYYPHNSRALVVVHKRQLQAPHVSKVALRQSEIRRLGKISLSAKKLDVKPVVKKISKNSIAAKVLSQSNVRKVEKGYVSGKTLLSPSRLKSSISKGSSQISQSKSSSLKGRTVSKKPLKSSTSIKTYPSKRTSSSLRSTYSSSSRQERSLRSKSSRSYSGKISSSKTISSRSKIKTYASRSSTSSLRSSSKGSSRIYPSKAVSSGIHKGKSSTKQYKPRSFSYSSKYSSSPKRSSSSRYVSPQRSSSSSRSNLSRSHRTPSRSYRISSRSSSRSSSSSRPVSSRSSSRSSVSRSSSRSSSSSSSLGRVKKK